VGQFTLSGYNSGIYFKDKYIYEMEDDNNLYSITHGEPNRMTTRRTLTFKQKINKNYYQKGDCIFCRKLQLNQVESWVRIQVNKSSHSDSFGVLKLILGLIEEKSEPDYYQHYVIDKIVNEGHGKGYVEVSRQFFKIVTDFNGNKKYVQIPIFELDKTWHRERLAFDISWHRQNVAVNNISLIMSYIANVIFFVRGGKKLLARTVLKKLGRQFGAQIVIKLTKIFRRRFALILYKILKDSSGSLIKETSRFILRELIADEKIKVSKRDYAVSSIKILLQSVFSKVLLQQASKSLDALIRQEKEKVFIYNELIKVSGSDQFIIASESATNFINHMGDFLLSMAPSFMVNFSFVMLSKDLKDGDVQKTKNSVEDVVEEFFRNYVPQYFDSILKVYAH